MSSIQVISRFRVKNGLEAAVRHAFFDRPHLVDQVSGFLGMDVYTDASDPTIVYLFTRWNDADSFRQWHGSDALRLSHQGIPRGIELDPGFTQVLILDRLQDSCRPPNLAEFTADAVLILAHHLASTQVVFLIVAAPDGTIRNCNAAIANLLKIPREQLQGRSLWQFLPDADTPHSSDVLRVTFPCPRTDSS